MRIASIRVLFIPFPLLSPTFQSRSAFPLPCPRPLFRTYLSPGTIQRPLSPPLFPICRNPFTPLLHHSPPLFLICPCPRPSFLFSFERPREAANLEILKRPSGANLTGVSCGLTNPAARC